MDWWHEDPELLSATLYMLAHADDDVYSPLPESAIVPVTPLHPSTLSNNRLPTTQARKVDVRPRPKVINASRERRRNEMRYLRTKVADLEAQLSILQQRRQEMLRPHRSESGEIRSMAAVWEAITIRQVRELRRQRLVNSELKTMIKNQYHVAKDLFAAIRKAEEDTHRQFDESNGLVTFARPRLAIDISQNISEENQLARLEVLCTQWYEAFTSSPKFNDGSLRFFEMQLVQDNDTKAIVDVYNSLAVPFPTDKVEEVYWRFFSTTTAHDDDGGSFVQDYQSRNDALIGIFHVVVPVRNHRTTLDGKFVTKRMRCPDKSMMYVSHIYSEPRCKSNLLEDVGVEEDSWMRIVPSDAVGGPKLTHPVTLLQEVRRLHIHFGRCHKDPCGLDNNHTEEPRQVGALTEFLMQLVEDEVKQGGQCIENMLLDDFGTTSVTGTPDEMS